MAKYYGAPWGTIRGKLNGSVGTVWRGIQTARKYNVPTDRGNLDKYRMLKEGSIPPELFSYEQFNIRRIIMNPLMKISSDELLAWIHPVWTSQTKEKHMVMLGHNLFVKRTFHAFLNSMPNKDQEFDPDTNSPDIAELKLADGDLEPTSEITEAEYNPTTGVLTTKWDTNVFQNGSATDQAWIIVITKPIIESIGETGNWQPALKILKIARELELVIPTEKIKRSHGETGVTLTLAPDLDASDLTVFVFFFNLTSKFSPSMSLQVTAP